MKPGAIRRRRLVWRKVRSTVLFFFLPYRELCRFIFEIKECNSNDYQLGTTRVFLRENLEREFEKERSEILHKAALTLQTNVRGYLARRKYHNIKRSTIKLQVTALESIESARDRNKIFICIKNSFAPRSPQ